MQILNLIWRRSNLCFKSQPQTHQITFVFQQGSYRLARKKFTDIPLDSHGFSLTRFMFKYIIFPDLPKKRRFLSDQNDITPQCILIIHIELLLYSHKRQVFDDKSTLYRFHVSLKVLHIEAIHNARLLGFKTQRISPHFCTKDASHNITRCFVLKI